MLAVKLGVIAPHPPIMMHAVGGNRSTATQASIDALSVACEAVRRFAPQTLVIMSPHAPGFSDAFVVDDSETFSGDLRQFGDLTRYTWRGDRALAQAIADAAAEGCVPCALRSEQPGLSPGTLDHATIVPLSFLDPRGSYSLVVLSLSGLDYGLHRRMGELVATAADAMGRRVAFIASGDLSHRLTRTAPAGFSPRAALLDEQIVAVVDAGMLERLAQIDPALIDEGGECGLRSFITLGGFCGPDPVASQVLAYEGPWGVGYLTALVGDAIVAGAQGTQDVESNGRKGGLPGTAEPEIVALARHAIELYVRHGEAVRAPQLSDPEMPARAGAFVSLHREGKLRGCIGTILPTRDTLALEVAANAVEAATRDPRFPPLSASELTDLEIGVDVLHAPESCTLEELDPLRFGVITHSGWRRGLLLPALEGVDDIETQVRIAMSKAGIRPGEPCSYERFLVDRYT